jgi:hypothetical protein
MTIEFWFPSVLAAGEQAPVTPVEPDAFTFAILLAAALPVVFPLKAL